MRGSPLPARASQDDLPGALSRRFPPHRASPDAGSPLRLELPGGGRALWGGGGCNLEILGVVLGRTTLWIGKFRGDG